MLCTTRYQRFVKNHELLKCESDKNHELFKADFDKNNEMFDEDTACMSISVACLRLLSSDFALRALWKLCEDELVAHVAEVECHLFGKAGA